MSAVLPGYEPRADMEPPFQGSITRRASKPFQALKGRPHKSPGFIPRGWGLLRGEPGDSSPGGGAGGYGNAKTVRQINAFDDPPQMPPKGGTPNSYAPMPPEGGTPNSPAPTPPKGGIPNFPQKKTSPKILPSPAPAFTGGPHGDTKRLFRPDSGSPCTLFACLWRKKPRRPARRQAVFSSTKGLWAWLRMFRPSSRWSCSRS